MRDRYCWRVGMSWAEVVGDVGQKEWGGGGVIDGGKGRRTDE